MGTSHRVAGIFNIFLICLCDYMIISEASQTELISVALSFFSVKPSTPITGNRWLRSPLRGLIPNVKADTFIIWFNKI